MSTHSSGGHSPWWLPWGLGIVIVFMPGFVMGVIDRAESSLNEYGDNLPDTTEQVDEYAPPCDVNAVLAALGMTTSEYQEANGLYVDGWVGPETGAAICAEEIPVGEP